MTSLPNHEAVLRAASRGDDHALELLVRTYHDRVYRFGRRVCRDGFDADDAVQEAFSLLSRREDVQRDPGVLSWLLSVVRNTCLRLLRPLVGPRARLSEQVALREQEEVPDRLDPEAALRRMRVVRSVHEAIAQLDREYREVIVLRDIEGLTGDEVSQALGLSTAAMKSRLHRARAMVRAQLAHLANEVH